MRLRLHKDSLNDKEALFLKHVLLKDNLQITSVKIHQKPASLMIEHKGDKNNIFNYLQKLDLGKIKEDIPENETAYNSKKELYKHMTPALKKDLRKEILTEAAMDIFLPAPIGIAYHMLQLACLEANT